MLQKIHVTTQIPPTRSLQLKVKYLLHGGSYMIMPLDDEEVGTEMWMILQMMNMSTMEIYLAESIGD
ncbi:unnamed protein product, partial [Cuscuta epithymum]